MKSKFHHLLIGPLKTRKRWFFWCFIVQVSLASLPNLDGWKYWTSRFWKLVEALLYPYWCLFYVLFLSLHFYVSVSSFVLFHLLTFYFKRFGPASFTISLYCFDIIYWTAKITHHFSNAFSMVLTLNICILKVNEAIAFKFMLPFNH